MLLNPSVGKVNQKAQHPLFKVWRVTLIIKLIIYLITNNLHLSFPHKQPSNSRLYPLQTILTFSFLSPSKRNSPPLFISLPPDLALCIRASGWRRRGTCSVTLSFYYFLLPCVVVTYDVLLQSFSFTSSDFVVSFQLDISGRRKYYINCLLFILMQRGICM